MLSLKAGGWSQCRAPMMPGVVLLALAGRDADDQPDKVVPIILGVILGAFCGAVVGMILARLIRFLAYLAGRDFEGHRLIFACALIGAGLFAWLVAR